MATNDSTERRAGATAIMAVAATLEQRLKGDHTQPCSEYFAAYDDAVAAMMAAAGPLPDRAAGALQAVIEIIVGGIQNCGDYDLTVFKPEATMTADEASARRQVLYEMEAQGLHKSEPSNVVQMRRH